MDLNMKNDIEAILKQESAAILNIPITDEYEKAVNLILEQVHQKKGKLVTSGMGKAGQIAFQYGNYFLLQWNAISFFAPERSPARRFGDHTRE